MVGAAPAEGGETDPGGGGISLGTLIPGGAAGCAGTGTNGAGGVMAAGTAAGTAVVAAVAGALQRQIVGPIWLKGVLVTDLWIGDPSDPPLQTAGDVKRALLLAVSCGLAIAAAGSAALLR